MGSASAGVLKLFCCTDTHGQVPPPIVEAGVHACLHAGDVYEGSDPESALAGPEIAAWIKTCPVPVFAVRGNHDIHDAVGFFDACNDVTGRVRAIAPGLWVAGVGWHGGEYYDLPTEAELASVCDDLRRQALRLVTGSDRLILLTHYPPSLAGRPVACGSPFKYRSGKPWRQSAPRPTSPTFYSSVAAMAEEFKPIAVVEGHRHECSDTSFVWRFRGGASLVINPGPRGAILEVDVPAARCRCWSAG